MRELHPSQPEPIARIFGDEQTTVIGTIDFPVPNGEHLVPYCIFYIVRHGTSILGQDLFDAINFQIVYGNSHNIRAITPSTRAHCKSIKGFVHKPVVNELLPSVAQPLLRVSLALLLKVKEELDRIMRDGVLKQIDAAYMVSNMVVAHKSNGGIRICVDLPTLTKRSFQTATHCQPSTNSPNSLQVRGSSAK